MFPSNRIIKFTYKTISGELIRINVATTPDGESIMIRKVYLDSLPRKGNKMDWLNSVGKVVKFTYDEIYGEVEICSVIKKGNATYLEIKYNNDLLSINTGGFSNCQFGALLGMYSRSRYNKETIIKEIKIIGGENTHLSTYKIRQVDGKLYKSIYNYFNTCEEAIRLSGYKIEKENSVARRFPDLIIEWGNKNIKSPLEYSYGSGQVVWWHCFKCNSDYDMSIHCRTGNNKIGCPYCANRRVNEGNCLWKTHPNVATLLKNSEIGFQVVYGSNRVEEFLCPNCNYLDMKTVNNVVSQGFSCPKCGDGISYPEKFIFNMLLQLNVITERQKKFNWSTDIVNKNEELNGDKIYDFYLPTFNCIIESHGEQHYKDTSGWNTDHKIVKANDNLKKVIAKNNSVSSYVIIDCSNSNLDYIKDNILKSDICNFLDLRNVDWNKCHENACSSLIKVASQLWSSGNDILHIANVLGVAKCTISKYLKQGDKIELCSYDPKNEMRKNGYKNSQKRIRPIVQLSKEMNYIKGWDSIKEAIASTSVSNISVACRGEQKTAGGFKWMYKEDYEKKFGKIHNEQDQLLHT